MKKVLSLLITLAMLVSCVVVPTTVSAAADTWDGTVAAGFAGGTGTAEDPFEIATAEQLAYLASTTFNAISTSTAAPVSVQAAGDVANMYNAYSGVYFKLTSDIDLANKEWLPIGRFNMRFNGVFDGDGHVVKNLKMEKNYFAMGLFGATGINAKIKNLGIDTAVFDYCSAVGGGVRYTYDYDAELGRTEATDASWSMPVIYKTTGSLGDRTFAVGTLVGVSGAKSSSTSDYMIEGCFARNVTINQKRNDLAQDNGGGLIGGTYYQVTAHAWPSAYVCIKDCYVNNLTITGAINRSGSFAGSPRMGNSNFDNATALRLTNCYAANSIGHKFDLFDPDGASNATSGCNLASDTKETVVSAFTTKTGWCADNAEAPVNAGYPVLKWENTWIWDGTSVANGYAGGDGTEGNPYQISNGAELKYFASQVIADATVSATTDIMKGKYFVLTSNIDLGNCEWTPIGISLLTDTDSSRTSASYHRFAGTFDGAGHVIKNYKITCSYEAVGLFGVLGTTAKIMNLGIENADIRYYSGAMVCNSFNNDTGTYQTTGAATHSEGAGTLAGRIGGSIENCYVKNSVIHNYRTDGSSRAVGGFAGKPESAGSLLNCYAIGIDLFMTTQGGLVGFNDNKTMTYTNCYTADITGATVCKLGTYTRNATLTPLARAATATGVNVYSAVAPAETDTSSMTTVATPKSDIVTNLIATGEFVNDNASSPKSDGYPILTWEKDWTKAYEAKGVTVADGSVTAVSITQNDAVDATVIVAVFDGERFVGAVTAIATNGVVTLATPIEVSAGNTVSVFVWDSFDMISPLSLKYSETVK